MIDGMSYNGNGGYGILLQEWVDVS